MKKRTVLILTLVLGMLLGTFSCVAADTPSPFFGSNDTDFGSFTVPIPDYYKPDKQKGVYGYIENENEGALLLISTTASGSITKSSFSSKKGEYLDTIIAKLGTLKRTSLQDMTVAGCPAVAGDYQTSKGLMRAVLVFNESEKEMLLLACIVTEGAVYGDYMADFEFCVNGVTLAGGTAGGADGVTLANFNKITTSMTYADVCKLFGKEGTLLSEADIGIAAYKTSIYTWTDSTGIANATITFQGGKVSIKSQFGLK